MKQKAKKWSRIALYSLIVPAVAMQFVDGWNWQWNSFLFMFLYIFIIAMTYEFVASITDKRKYKFLIGCIFILGAFAVWGRLATG